MRFLLSSCRCSISKFLKISSELLRGHDAVVHAVKFQSTDVHAVIDATKKASVPHLLVVGGAGTLEVAAHFAGRRNRALSRARGSVSRLVPKHDFSADCYSVVARFNSLDALEVID
jgi:hypothetical protein